MIQSVKNNARLKILTKDQVDRIHEASLGILGRTGLRVDGEDARKRLLENGAERHSTRKDVLIFPRELVEDSIKKIPRYGKYFARDPKNDVTFDGRTTYAHVGGGDPNIIDLDTGEIRRATFSDLAQLSRLTDALDYCSSAGNLVVATDVPERIQVIKTMEAVMKNTTKSCGGYALRKEEVDALVRMWSVVAGGTEQLRKRPLLGIYGSPSSPLTYDTHVCDVMIRAAECGVPVDLVPCPISGGTAPATLAGGLAQQNAELLGGVMLLQTITTKLPIVYCGRLFILDQRTGSLGGMTETALASAATVQIAHRYHMAADVYGVSTGVNYWDMQTGLERMEIGMVPGLAGADGLSGMGTAWGSACSYEMLVIDNEVYADIFRTIRGFEVDDEHLALDIIDKVGHMGNFLGQMHTMKHMRLGEVRYSSLFDARSSEKARREGFRALQTVAKEQAKKILKEHVPTPLDKDVEKDLDRVIREESKKLLAGG